MSRPIQFTHVLSREILDRLAQGEPIEWILDDDHMPTIGTVRDWKLQYDEFAKAYEIAFKDGLMRLALETLDIADTPRVGEEVTEQQSARGRVLARTVKKVDMLGHRKLQIEARWRLLETLDPDRFGKKSKVDTNVNVPEDVGVVIYKLPDNGR